MIWSYGWDDLYLNERLEGVAILEVSSCYLDPNKGYTISVYIIYCILWIHVDRLDITNIVWNKFASLKVSLFAWRLLRNHIPSKDNWIQRGNILTNSNMCSSDCGTKESVNHLFLGWDFFGSLCFLDDHMGGNIWR